MLDGLWEISEPRFLRKMANEVYAAKSAGGDVIVRLTEPSHRSFEEIQAELEWIAFLHGQDCAVARPIPSLHGNWVERTDTHFAVVFQKVPGERVTEPTHFRPEIFRRWGAVIGKIQRVSKGFSSPRLNWEDDSNTKLALQALDPTDHLGYHAYKACEAWLAKLPRGPEHFGLVHADLHHGNFLVSGRDIAVFDFDDSCRHWYGYDLAVPWFHLTMEREMAGEKLSREKFFDFLLEGFETERPIPDEWRTWLPGFFRCRLVTVYLWLKGIKERTPMLDRWQDYLAREIARPFAFPG